MLNKFIYNALNLCFDTPAPGTESLILFTGSLDKTGLPVDIRSKNRQKIHSKPLLHSKIIHQNA